MSQQLSENNRMNYYHQIDFDSQSQAIKHARELQLELQATNLWLQENIDCRYSDCSLKPIDKERLL